jgi:hypothetical protein
MTNSMFRQAWDEALAKDPLRDPRAEANARVKRYAHQLRYILTGFTFAIAGVLLALAVATVLQGEFDALRLGGAVPALGATFLGVHGLRRLSFPFCAAALAVLLAYSALHALL